LKPAIAERASCSKKPDLLLVRRFLAILRAMADPINDPLAAENAWDVSRRALLVRSGLALAAYGALAPGADEAEAQGPGAGQAAPGSGSGIARPEDHGAAGDGQADDTEALRQTIETGLPVWLRTGATYLCSGALNLVPGQALHGNGAELKRRAQAISATRSAVTAKQTTSVAVADPSKFAVGMDVVLLGGSDVRTAPFDGTARRIVGIAGDRITVDSPFGITVSGSGTLCLCFALLHLADGCAVRDLDIDGNRSEWSFYRWQVTSEIFADGTGTTVERCRLFDAPGEGIFTLNDFNSVVSCEVRDANGNGIHFSDVKQVASKHIVVHGSRFVNCNLDPVVGHADGAITWSNWIRDCTISACYVENAIAGIGSVDSTDNSGVTVVGCTFRKCREAAADLVCPPSKAPAGIIFASNRFYDSGPLKISGGVGSAVRPSEVIVTGNTFAETGLQLVRCGAVKVEGNLFTESGSGGRANISVHDCGELEITRNRMRGGDWGVLVNGVASSPLIVDGNTFVGQRAAAVRVEREIQAGPVISGNVIRHAAPEAGYSALLVLGHGALVRANLLQLAEGARGIDVRGDRALVKGNTVRNGKGASIAFAGGTSGGLARDNEVTGSVTGTGGANVEMGTFRLD
jgi:hypothetical protein